MGLLDRVLGRKADLEPEYVPAGLTRADARVVGRYERMLRTASPEVIERVHVEAFEKLTPEQLDLLFERFTADAPTADDRPTDARPRSLARSATVAEARRPGAIKRTLQSDDAGVGLNTVIGASILDSVIWYAVASSAWSAWNASDAGGSDAASAEATGADAGGFDGGDIWDLGF